MSESATPHVVNSAEQSDRFDDVCPPKTLARYNVMTCGSAKPEGEAVGRSHRETDEIFMILQSEFDIDLREPTATSDQANCSECDAASSIDRPRRGLAKLPWIDPNGTPNTGDVATATHVVAL